MLKSSSNLKGSSKSKIRNEKEGMDQFAEIMWPVIFLIKCFGHSPLSFDGREYKSFRFSVFLIWSGIIGLAFSGMYAFAFSTIMSTFASETANSTDSESLPISMFFGPQNQASSEALPLLIKIGKVTILLTVLIQTSEIVFSWGESKSVAIFLNHWMSIQREFKEIFQFNCHLPQQASELESELSTATATETKYHGYANSFYSLKRFRNILLVFYVGSPTFTGACLTFLIYTPFGFLATLPVLLDVGAVTWLGDVQVLMTYAFVASAFNKIRGGIKYSLQWEKLNANKIKNWRKLIMSVRRQVSVLGESQKCHQLVLIEGSIFSITAYIYMLVNTPPNIPNFGAFAFIFGGYAIVLISRIYFKILAANLIQHEEYLIAQEILRVNPANADNELMTQLELTYLHDIITHHPSVISFSSYVTLDKRLLLSVSSQVVTYLIVLLQF